MGINLDDFVVMVSFYKVVLIFFNVVDKKEGSFYVFRGDDEFLKEFQKKIFEFLGVVEDSD